jgi:hypothetical protein
VEGNDIGVTVFAHRACMFEGLIMTPQEEEMQQTKGKWWKRLASDKEEYGSDDRHITSVVKRWRPNEMPLKSLYHLVNHYNIGVEVYTYLPEEFVPAIEHWLARKGISVTVYPYDDVFDLIEDFKYNRDVQVLYTPSETDAQAIGIRATVALPDRTFGI